MTAYFCLATFSTALFIMRLRPESGQLSKDPTGTSFTTEQREQIVAFTGFQGPVNIWSYVDAVYVPKRSSVELTNVLNQFSKYNVFLELALGLALVAVEPTKSWEDWTQMYIWGSDERPHWRKHLTSGIAMLHLVKLTTDPKAKNDLVHSVESTDAHPLLH